MKKTLFIAFISIMAMPMTMFGQSYKNMWKQLEEAVQKDLPQQVIQKAEQITQKARKEREYGHLLKAQLMMMGMQSSVSPDSLQPAVSISVLRRIYFNQRSSQSKNVLCQRIPF